MTTKFCQNELLKIVLASESLKIDIKPARVVLIILQYLVFAIIERHLSSVCPEGNGKSSPSKSIRFNVTIISGVNISSKFSKGGIISCRHLRLVDCSRHL